MDRGDLLESAFEGGKFMAGICFLITPQTRIMRTGLGFAVGWRVEDRYITIGYLLGDGTMLALFSIGTPRADHSIAIALDGTAQCLDETVMLMRAFLSTDLTLDGLPAERRVSPDRMPDWN